MKRPCNAQVALWASLSVGRVLVERTTSREVAIFYQFMGASSRLLFRVKTCRAWERVAANYRTTRLVPYNHGHCPCNGFTFLRDALQDGRP